MRNACREALCAALIVLFSVPLRSEENPNGLVMDSVHPELDARYISQMRRHMSEVRAKEGRPTVALVLSGGGAKGAAQLGVKQLIDELGIPVDLICGTSIGGMIGGLLAVGYTPEFIDSLFTHQDWGVTLTDRIAPSYFSVEDKMYKSRYLLSVPFHYQKETFDRRIKEQETYSQHKGKLHLGANDTSSNVGMNTTASSLPAGYAYGFNVNNLLSSLTVGYQDSLDFKDLPIPFYCVSADLISCKAMNWGSGVLKTAMRSTMSIPALFKPVRTQGMVLVDGGIRNNFPVDIARAMGADYVIGVELSDRLLTYSEMNNIGDMISQLTDMMGKESHDKNVNDCDVFIKPDLNGYNMLSFKPEAIDTMISRGHQAAMLHKDELLNLKHMLGDWEPKLNGRPAIDIAKTPVQLRSIRFDGLSDRESAYLQFKIKLKAGQFVTAADLHDAMSKIQATGCFESVTYSLLGKESPFDLVFNCSKGPVHQVGLGIRADNVEWVSMAFNLGLNAHKLMGSKFDFNLKLGPCQSFDFRYSLDLPKMPTLNADFKISNASMDVFDHDEGKYSPTFWSHRERVYLSNLKWTRLDIKAGFQNQYFDMYKELHPSDAEYVVREEHLKGNYQSLFINAGLYTLDDLFFPSRGTHFDMGYEIVLGKSGVPGFRPYHILFLNWKPVFSIGEHFAIIPDIHLRSFINTNGQTASSSMGLANYVGGGFAGRYLDQTVPLAGYKTIYAAKDHLALVNLAFRVSPFKDFYITAEGGALRDADAFGDMFRTLKPDLWSTALGVGYDSIFGPLKLEIEWSKNLGLGYYFSLGYDF